MQVFCNYTHGLRLPVGEQEIVLKYGDNTVNGRIFNAWLEANPNSSYLADNNLYVAFEEKAATEAPADEPSAEEQQAEPIEEIPEAE